MIDDARIDSLPVHDYMVPIIKRGVKEGTGRQEGVHEGGFKGAQGGHRMNRSSKETAHLNASSLSLNEDCMRSSRARRASHCSLCHDDRRLFQDFKISRFQF